MPHSGTLLDAEAQAFIAATGARTVLDIGPGAGKYARLVRAALPEARLTGVEIEPDYVDQFGLRFLYDDLRVMPALDLLADIEAEWDLAILGDVIEHHRKSEGLDLLHFLVYRTRYLLVQYPEKYRQNALNGYRSEAHLSVWHESDFAPFEHVLIKQTPLVLVALRGYLPGEPVSDLAARAWKEQAV
jgi:SAM-dependent methyltransferase